MVGKQLDAAMTDFVWNVLEIGSLLGDIRKTWAEQLGVSEAQWLILMAIEDLNQGGGVSGVDVATKLRTHATFVAMHTKHLEKAGLLSRKPSPIDGRLVLMSLTARARAEIQKLSDQREALNGIILENVDARSLTNLNATLAIIRKNSERALRASVDA
ncbi:MarR family transcriptional regulator [Bradyrhizobium jicamae]|uniref:MarR family winged helix-turn-helix transcriptional regulator n=1 Tax=Bradyrhizobium jicamae TaxID=280332 RepID=UPI001BACAE4F|nr:MarR family transcriptional regulator [Bradyrhizobium jicamae]MBR0751272.1 MarR family transcriptional regulator [Bradyrhizobium jicamae]